MQYSTNILSPFNPSAFWGKGNYVEHQIYLVVVSAYFHTPISHDEWTQVPAKKYAAGGRTKRAPVGFRCDGQHVRDASTAWNKG